MFSISRYVVTKAPPETVVGQEIDSGSNDAEEVDTLASIKAVSKKCVSLKKKGAATGKRSLTLLPNVSSRSMERKTSRSTAIFRSKCMPNRKNRFLGLMGLLRESD